MAEDKPTAPFRSEPNEAYPGTVLCVGPRVPGWAADFLGFRIEGMPEKSMNREMAERVADALNAAIENEEHPWVGEGPTIAEAEGGTILARIPDGDLVRFVWNRTLPGWTSAAFIGTPVGWRRMPRLATTKG